MTIHFIQKNFNKCPSINYKGRQPFACDLSSRLIFIAMHALTATELYGFQSVKNFSCGNTLWEYELARELDLVQSSVCSKRFISIFSNAEFEMVRFISVDDSIILWSAGYSTF